MDLLELCAEIIGGDRATAAVVFALSVLLSLCIAFSLGDIIEVMFYALAAMSLLTAILVWCLVARSQMKGYKDFIPVPNGVRGIAADNWENLMSRGKLHTFFLKNFKTEIGHYKESAFHKLCKSLFAVMWFGLCFIYVSALGEIGLPVYALDLLVFLCVVATVQSCSSYLFCCVCLWLVAEVSKLEGLEFNPCIKEYPELSSLIAKMKQLSARNALIFLFESLFFSVAVFACIGLFVSFHHADGAGIICKDMSMMGLALFCVLSLGYLTFAILLICPRLFIGRLLNRWRLAALESIEYRWGWCGLSSLRIAGYDLLPSVSRALGAERGVAAMDVAMLVLALATLVVNVASVVLALKSP